jgi:ADP-heptose:LPS heptosyltransferase
MDLIGETDLFISNDSGLMNIAAALGRRVLNIAGGPTDPVRTRPSGDGNAIVFSDIACYPCRGLGTLGQRFRCVYETRRCLEGISVDRVYALACALMS